MNLTPNQRPPSGVVRTRHTKFAKAFNRIAESPARLMTATWIAYVGLWYSGLVQSQRGIAGSTWALIGACIGAFVLGCRASSPIFLRAPKKEPQQGCVPTSYVESLARKLAIIGLFGGFAVAVDKVFLSGIDFSSGFTTVRLQGNDLGTEFFASYNRSPILYVGLLTFSFSTVAFALCILRSDSISSRVLMLAVLSLASPLTVGIVYGGRTSILLVPAMALGAIAVRSLGGAKGLGRIRKVAPSLLLMLALSVGYNNVILQQRRAYFDLTSASSELNYTETARGFKVKGWVHNLVANSTLPPSLIVDAVSVNMYILQGPVYFSRLLDYEGPVGPYFGQFEVSPAGSVLERVSQDLSVRERMFTELASADVLGAFLSAWGALYVDLGLVGLFLAAGAWGFVSARVWRRMRFRLGAQLIGCFLVVSIVISPMHSLLGFGSSFFLLIDLVVAAALLRRMEKRPSLRAQDS